MLMFLPVVFRLESTFVLIWEMKYVLCTFMYDTFLLDVFAPPLPHPVCMVGMWCVHMDIWLLVQSCAHTEARGGHWASSSIAFYPEALHIGEAGWSVKHQDLPTCAPCATGAIGTLSHAGLCVPAFKFAPQPRLSTRNHLSSLRSSFRQDGTGFPYKQIYLVANGSKGNPEPR